MTMMSRLRTSPLTPWVMGGLLVAFVAVLPLLDLSLPGVLPGSTYTPGTLQLLAFAMVFAALALSYHLLFGVAGLLSFGHALYFAIGAYGLGIVLRDTELALVPAMAVVLMVVGPWAGEAVGSGCRLGCLPDRAAWRTLEGTGGTEVG